MTDTGRRIEHDLLGDEEVPADALWGIHTQRAVRNFPFRCGAMHSEIVKAMGAVKEACAQANLELGYLAVDVGDAIIASCGEIQRGLHGDAFPIAAMQGGAGTSTNMNVNEVIANLALEKLGRPRGDYETVHPLRHVNLHQSTNDTYPTAVKIAVIWKLKELADRVAVLQGRLQEKEQEFSDIIAIGRTELQDAVPITLGSQFASFAEAVGRDRWRIFKATERIRSVNLGGTAVGTGLTAPRQYIFLAIEKLRVVTGLPLTRGDQVMDATANADPFVEVSGMLAANAANMIKVCRDLRLLHSFGEIVLPPVQAGSSIMAGKVNPVIMEACIQAGMKMQANDALVGRIAAEGTLQINEYMPLLAESMLESLDLLATASEIMAPNVQGIDACVDVCRRHVDESEALVTAFIPQIGYERAEELVRSFRNLPGRPVMREFLAEQLGQEMVDRTLRPSALMSLGQPGGGGGRE